MENDKLHTEFAPAERADRNDIDLQAQSFGADPLIQQLLNTVPDIFLILNEHRQAVFVNRAMLDMLKLDNVDSLLGLRPGELLGCSHAFDAYGGCGTTEFCKTCGAVQATVASLKGKGDVQECRITQRDGTALDLRIWTTPLLSDGRQYTTFTIQDISDEKRHRTLERIFFHDILNTAGVIQGFAEFLDEGNLDDAIMAKDEIRRLSNRLVNEIKGQQELASAENHELRVHLAPLNAKGFLWEIAEMYRNHETAKDRYIGIAPQSQPVDFVSDPTLLGRVIGNMVKNALEASAPGETVTIGCQLKGNSLEFWVHNPRYMPRHTQLQVFQRSFSTKGAGRGLGTYSMKLLSERYLNGQVSFTSFPEEGTTFRACYPLRRDA
ncbi:MAG: PAS domain-containing sensor histidine kinase [Anaerolineae bacterium]|nr:PAS domain-containing sensor histidine kinase [Anaerolineae bacterium]